MAPAEHQIHGAPRLALASVTGILMALYLLWVVGQNAAALMALQRCGLGPTVSKACSLASGVGSAVYVSGVLLLPALAALFGGLACAALGSRRPVAVALGTLFLGSLALSMLPWLLRWMATPPALGGAGGATVPWLGIVSGCLNLACAVLLWRRWRHAVVFTAAWLLVSGALSVPTLSGLAALSLSALAAAVLVLVGKLTLMVCLTRPHVRAWFADGDGADTRPPDHRSARSRRFSSGS